MTEGLVPEPVPATAGAPARTVGVNAPVVRRIRGGSGLSMALPGMPQLMAGRIGAGGAALLLWLGSLAILALRWERVRAAPGGELDERIALATLALALAGSWIWSLRDVRKGPGIRFVGVSQWTLAARAFSRNRLAVVGALAIVALYMTALLTPFLAPYDPAVQGNLLTERLVAPSGLHPLGTDHFARDVL